MCIRIGDGLGRRLLETLVLRYDGERGRKIYVDRIWEQRELNQAMENEMRHRDYVEKRYPSTVPCGFGC